MLSYGSTWSPSVHICRHLLHIPLTEASWQLCFVRIYCLPFKKFAKNPARDQGRVRKNTYRLKSDLPWFIRCISLQFVKGCISMVQAALDSLSKLDLNVLPCIFAQRRWKTVSWGQSDQPQEDSRVGHWCNKIQWLKTKVKKNKVIAGKIMRFIIMQLIIDTT